MLTLLAVLAFVIGLVIHEGGGEFLSLDSTGWTLLGLALFAAAHLWDVRPWNRA